MSQQDTGLAKAFKLSKFLYNQFSAIEQKNRLKEEEVPQFHNKFIKPLYPHEVHQQNGQTKFHKYTCSSFCCKLSMGNFCCFGSSEPDTAYKDLGLGICLYFKFLKHMILTLIFISLLSLIPIGIYYYVNIETGFDVTSGYKQFIFSSTIGAMTTDYLKCSYAKASNTTQTSLEAYCPVGTVSLIGLVYSEYSLQSVQHCKIQIDKIKKSMSEYYVTSLSTNTTTCNSGNTKCTTFFKINEALKYSRVSLAYECKNVEYKIGSVTMPKQNFLYIAISIDLITVLVILFFLWSERVAQNQQIQYFKEKQLTLKDFALEVSYFSRKDLDQQINQFMKGLNEHFNREYFREIIEIKIPQNPNYLDYQLNRIYQCNKLKAFIEQKFYELNVDPNSFSSVQQFSKKYFNTPQEIQSFQNELWKLINEFEESQQYRNQVQDEQVSLYYVFQSIKDKRRIMANVQEKCCSNQLILNNKVYYISHPPVPDMIIWKNQNKFTCLRIIISWTITLTICFASYILVGVAQWQKRQSLKDYNFAVDCSVLYTDSELQTWSSTLYSANNAEYKQCFCSKHIYDLSVSDSDWSNCQDWQSRYIIYILVPLMISLGLVIYNLGISYLFKFLTWFQSHKKVTSQLLSYTIKRAFILIMNMGLIMTILTLNYGPSTTSVNQFKFLFQGTYDDITSDWYLNIGIIITLTMLLNIFYPILQVIMSLCLKCLRKTWDRKCCCVLTSKKTKKQYLELYSGDIFPIEERYAIIIAIVLITLAFNCVMPLLNVIMLFSFLLLFLCDKVLIFKVYRKPINYDDRLQNYMIRIIFFGCIIHLICTALLISQPYLVLAGKLSETTIISISNQRFSNMFQTGYIVPYVIFAILLVIFAVFKTTIINCFIALSQRCCKNEGTQIHRQKLKANFFDVASQHQLNLLLKANQNQRNKYHSNRSIMDKYQVEMTMLNLKQQQQDIKIDYREVITKGMVNRIQKELKSERKTHRNTKLIGMPAYEVLFEEDNLVLEKIIYEIDQKIDSVLHDK